MPERGLLDQVVGVVVQDTLEWMLIPKETAENKCVYMHVSVHVYTYVYMYMYVPLKYHNIVSLCAHLHAYLHYA